MTEPEGNLTLSEQIFAGLMVDEEGRAYFPEPAIVFVMSVMEIAFKHSPEYAESVYTDVAVVAAALEEQGFDEAAGTLITILLQAEPLAEEAGFSGRDAIEKAKADPAAALLGREQTLRAPKVGEKAPEGTFKVGMIPPGGRRM